MAAWDAYVDVMTGTDEKAKANWSCWMQRYMTGCVLCPPCPGTNPFKPYE